MVLAPHLHLHERIDPEHVAQAVRRSLKQADITDGESPVALAFPWRGDPSHARLHAIASGICTAPPGTLAAGAPLVLLIDGEVAMSLGRTIRHEIAPDASLISVDGVQLKQFDYVDIGAVIAVTNVVPVIIKSLLFK